MLLCNSRLTDARPFDKLATVARSQNARTHFICRAISKSHPRVAASTPNERRAAAARRGVLLSGAALMTQLLNTQPSRAFEWFGMEVARKVLRPAGEQQAALVALLDARGTLKELAALAATPLDSEERFRSRYLLPGMAKFLREVATSAPIVAEGISGDMEGSMSEKYGGTGQEGGLTDPVYEALGRVLTISGRTIKEEAQVDPTLAQRAAEAITNLLSYVPEDKLDTAQEFRIQRAKQV